MQYLDTNDLSDRVSYPREELQWLIPDETVERTADSKQPRRSFQGIYQAGEVVRSLKRGRRV